MPRAIAQLLILFIVLVVIIAFLLIMPVRVVLRVGNRIAEGKTTVWFDQVRLSKSML